jgi:hypothetical protein
MSSKASNCTTDRGATPEYVKAGSQMGSPRDDVPLASVIRLYKDCRTSSIPHH